MESVENVELLRKDRGTSVELLRTAERISDTCLDDLNLSNKKREKVANDSKKSKTAISDTPSQIPMKPPMKLKNSMLWKKKDEFYFL